MRATGRGRTLALAALAASATVAAGCAIGQNPLTGKKRPYAYSWAQERQLGAQADEQIIAQFGLYEDPELQRYVDRVGAEVLAESHLRRAGANPEFKQTPFEFRILDSEVVNAFALPGGYVYVTRGLLSHLENEAQLAVVLGHEVAHVAGRHASERAFEQQLGQLALFGGAVLAQEALGVDPGNVMGLGGAAAQLLFLQYSRDDERESDQLGVEYAALAGYEAAEGAGFFRALERMQEQSGGMLPSFLSTHPDPGQRQEKIREMAATWESRTNMTEVGRDRYLQTLEGMVAGQDPRQGFVRQGVFYHPELRFRFSVPRGFQAVNQASQVMMVEEQGQRAVLAFQIAQEQSAEAAAQKFASQQGLQILERGTGATDSGLPASFVLGAGQNQQGQTVNALAWFLEYQGKVYGFLGLAGAQDFGAFRETFLSSMRSFGPVTDRSILQVQPARIQVVKTDRRAAFRELVPARLPEGFTPQDLAIMNQVELNEVLPAGTLIKTVR